MEDNLPEFKGFPKIARWSRRVIITEKIDGTNAQILITPGGQVFAGSRNRWLTPASDNYGFAKWVRDNQTELLKLGEGRHFGEWWGQGINRNYGLDYRKFSLFNVDKWSNPYIRPLCCDIVPILADTENFTDSDLSVALDKLAQMGSLAAPGFYKPEGIVVFHTASNTLFKKTIEGDEKPKGLVAA